MAGYGLIPAPLLAISVDNMLPRLPAFTEPHDLFQHRPESGTVKPWELRRVTVESTVLDQAVTFPTDGKLRNRSRVRLVKRCRRHGVGLHQSYARKRPQAPRPTNRYAHARPLRFRNRPVRRLRTSLGRGPGHGTKNRWPSGPWAGVCRRTGHGPAVAGIGEEWPKPAVPPTCTGSGVHSQGQGPPAVRVQREGEHSHHQPERIRAGGMVLAGNPDDGQSKNLFFVVFECIIYDS